MLTKIVALVVFTIPFIILTSFYPGFYSYSFYNGPQNTPLEKWIMDAIAFLFSGAIGLITYLSLERLKPIWNSFLSLLQTLYEENKNKEKIP